VLARAFAEPQYGRHGGYPGWAFVDILEESTPTPDESYYLIHDRPQSFEADSWIGLKR
jgi:hypothetical protein